MYKNSRPVILLALLALFAAPLYAGSPTVAPTPLATGSLTVAWDPNPATDNIASYTVFYGTQSGSYPWRQTVAGGVTTLTVSNLTGGQIYYFAVQATNSDNLSSPLSMEAVGTVPASPTSTVCAGVTVTAPSMGALGSPVAFSAQAGPSGCTGAVTYQWAFGDGTSSTLASVSHTYYTAQGYTWTLLASVDGVAVAVAPPSGTITVTNDVCTTARTVVAAPPAKAGMDPIAAMWQDMGVTVHAGDALRITAAGTWINGGQGLTAAGDGSQVVTGPNCPMPGAPLLALVARIGTTGTPFLVQNGQAMPSTTTGPLYLAPNDNWYTLWDNSGSLAVTICAGAPVPVACTGVTAAAPATGAVGSPVAFTAQPSPSGCTGTVTYQWALGDGTTSTQATVSHAYYAAQGYTWTLSARVDGVAVAPQTGTVAVSNDVCTTGRTVMAAPPGQAGMDPVAAMWQDMGVTVHAGDNVRVTAAGTWGNGSQGLTAAGDGSQVLTGPNSPMSGAPLMALVGRVGSTGTPFVVQSGQAIPATATGSLYLAPNDNWYTLWDNTGSLAITICAGAPVPVACTGVTATAPATGGVGSPVAFTAQPSPPGCTGTATYDWALGDGATSTQATLSHTYYTAQSYTWTLSAAVDGVAVTPKTGTIAVSNDICSPARTVVAAPPAKTGVGPIAAMWQDTGVTVNAGQQLVITAAGTWRNGTQVLTAAGNASQVLTGTNSPMSGAPLLALVARIGPTGTPFLVQSGQAIPVTATGTLYLAPNDTWYTLWNDTGSLAVTICSRQ